MRIIYISYNFNKKKDYEPFFNAIQSLGDCYSDVMPNAWLAYTDMEIEQCYRVLKAHIDDDDELFLIELKDVTYYGWVSNDIWDWLGSKIQN